MTQIKMYHRIKNTKPVLTKRVMAELTYFIVCAYNYDDVELFYCVFTDEKAALDFYNNCNCVFAEFSVDWFFTGIE